MLARSGTDDIRLQVERVTWIGGAIDSGKTTVAPRIAEVHERQARDDQDRGTAPPDAVVELVIEHFAVPAGST